MNMVNENVAGPSTPLEKFELALQQAVVNGRNKRENDFKDAYLLIEQHLTRKVPQKKVLDIFNTAYGYTMHPPRFRKMLLDERKRRTEAGDFVTCAACSQPLPTEKSAAEMNSTEEQ